MIALCLLKKSIPSITSKSFISMAIKSACSVTPFIVIGICRKKNSEVRTSPEGKAVLTSLEVLFLTSLRLKANLVDMKECDAPESNSVYTS